ncbi:HipA domain-containing protein [Cupriavidus sp. AcVe19-6a]|uniref:HipA domain-containing protein n=1 Tax=Cupriavidus sp. AcVe19-6a TaxID=2821358 RepID=UPI001FD75ACC|nr:HipA domain-containing protein [Cupriavidus sp. AcVe19-6a]
MPGQWLIGHITNLRKANNTFCFSQPALWGRRVIDWAFNPHRRAAIDYLALAGEDRIGALGFASMVDSYEVNHPPVFHRGDLPGLIEAARAVELQLPIDDRLRQLLRPGGTAGGARSKAIIDDDGSSWIAKFPAEGDEVDFCAIEHASLVLAQGLRHRRARVSACSLGSSERVVGQAL